MKQFEKLLGYEFKKQELLFRALTHSSFANESHSNISSNERLEFLGDSVLSLVTSEYLFNNYVHLPEGELTKTRATLVCENSLHEFAKEIDLGTYIKLGKGETHTGGRTRPSILADAFEAIIAAIYLDGGMEEASKFVLRFIKKGLQTQRKPFKDYKTTLQEIIQKNPEERLEYVMVGSHGPDHDKRFDIQIRLNSNVIGTGSGKSKKQAEQEAAKQALELMGV